MGGGDVGSADGVTGTGIGVDVGATVGEVGSADAVTGTGVGVDARAAVGEADSMVGVAGAEVGNGDGLAVAEEGSGDGVISPEVGNRVAMVIGSREGVGEPAHPTTSSTAITKIALTRILCTMTLLPRVSFALTSAGPGANRHCPSGFCARQERFAELISGNLGAMLCHLEG